MDERQTVRTDPEMPPMGVADVLLRDAEPSSVERFRFWLLTHDSLLDAMGLGPRVWQTIVLRECVPDPACELVFTAQDGLLGGRS